MTSSTCLSSTPRASGQAITWTTLGYGDIVPGEPAARAIAGIEAITGYVVMALLISALVELFKAN